MVGQYGGPSKELEGTQMGDARYSTFWFFFAEPGCLTQCVQELITEYLVHRRSVSLFPLEKVKRGKS